MNTNLLPCPFCGGPVNETDREGNDFFNCFYCDNCPVEFTFTDVSLAGDSYVRLWNTRDINNDSAEILRLRAQLAAIRDAGDKEIDDLAREAGNGIGSDYYQDKSGCHESEESLDRLKDIAKARGLRIKELEKELDAWIDRCECGKSLVLHLTEERDDAVGLLKWLVKRFVLINGLIRRFATLGDHQCKRILEIIGKGE